jgi:16S rRNA U516 pseudouridylate synthase RsuA-like enzyme
VDVDLNAIEDQLNRDNDELEEFMMAIDADSIASKQVATSFVRVGVTEGKYRMVRRILHNAGHSVLELHRVRYGDITLGGLESGMVRRGSDEEEEWAQRLLSAAERKS